MNTGKRSITKLLSLIVIVAMMMTTITGCQKSGKTVDSTEKEFEFVVIDKELNETEFTINTTKTYVGEALMEEGLIEGEEGPYGLYVKEVNGIEAIYENDGTYWSFYINGEYAMTGVDATEIEDGATYMFKVEGN